MPRSLDPQELACLGSQRGATGLTGGSLRRQGQGCRASPMRSDESTWQLGLAKATISSSSSSAGIFLPSTWGRSCRGPLSPPAGIDHGEIADGGGTSESLWRTAGQDGGHRP